MILRRALRLAVVCVAALAAAGEARAQQPPAGAAPGQAAAGQLPRGRPLPVAPLVPSAVPDEPLARLDDGAMAGGAYGGEPPPLAGGDYGRPPPEPQRQTPAPAAATIDVGDPFARRPTLRSGAAELRPQRRMSADDAYAPLGVRAGSFILRPTIESAGGYDDNPDRKPTGGKGSSFLRLRGDLEAQSDWSRHELRAQFTGQARRYVDLQDPGYEPEVNATVDGRADVTERTQILTQLRTSITTSRPGDPETLTDVKGDEIERSFGATLGVAQSFNRLSFRLDGLVDRYLFDDSKLLDGSTVSNANREYTGYQLRLRGAYEVSPALAPFAEIAVDTRDYDEKYCDECGDERRGSSGWALRGGARFEATRLVTGEFAVGYGHQTPKDNDLKAVDGLLVDGSLAWVPTALTTVRLNARSSIDETTLSNSGGILRRTLGLEIEHALRRNFIVTGRADFESSRYKGVGRVDDTLVLGLEAEYRLNRTVSLIGSFEHERLDSNQPGEDYAASIIEFGLRVRR